MKKVLISGFTPFNKSANNYSAEVLAHIETNDFSIDKVIIDVVYDRSFDELSANGLEGYDFILSLGEARMRSVLTVESRARNLSHCSIPDNAGVLKQNELIDPTAPEYLISALDLESISDIAEISLDAGRFVCNNLYFHLLQHDPHGVLFIHIPECNNDEALYKLYADKVVMILKKLLYSE